MKPAMVTNQQQQRRSVEVLRVVTYGYGAAMVVVSHWPGLSVTAGVSKGIPTDKVLHAIGYCGLGVCLGLWSNWANRRDWTAMLRCVVFVAVFALLDEVTQPLFGRSCEPLDWVADVLGGVAGLAATYLFLRLRAVGVAAFNAKL